MLDKPEHPIVIEAPEEVLQIRFQHLPDLAAINDLIEGCQSMMALSRGLPPNTRGRSGHRQ
jgi:hypothetical protein